MKTVYIATDSRGSVADHASKQSRESSWTERFKTKYPGNNYITRRSAMEIPTHHLYDSEILAKYPDKSIDLAILQTAMNSGIEYYSPGIFQMIFGKYYDASGLIHGHEDRYIYSHPESEAKMFALINQKCKRVVWIGLHIMDRYRNTEPSSKWTPTYSDLARAQNERYSKMVTDYVALPWDDAWVDVNCHPDLLHYLEPGVDYILNQLAPIAEEVLNG